MDYENNDFGQVELGAGPFQPDLDQSISQQVENPPLVVNIKFLLQPNRICIFH